MSSYHSNCLNYFGRSDWLCRSNWLWSVGLSFHLSACLSVCPRCSWKKKTRGRRREDADLPLTQPYLTLTLTLTLSLTLTPTLTLSPSLSPTLFTHPYIYIFHLQKGGWDRSQQFAHRSAYITDEKQKREFSTDETRARYLLIGSEMDRNKVVLKSEQREGVAIYGVSGLSYGVSSRFVVVCCPVVCASLVSSCCFISSCLALSCLVLSCLVMSCLVLSRLVLSCLVLSCLVLGLPSVVLCSLSLSLSHPKTKEYRWKGSWPCNASCDTRAKLSVSSAASIRVFHSLDKKKTRRAACDGKTKKQEHSQYLLLQFCILTGRHEHSQCLLLLQNKTFHSTGGNIFKFEMARLWRAFNSIQKQSQILNGKNKMFRKTDRDKTTRQNKTRHETTWHDTTRYDTQQDKHKTTQDKPQK